MNGLLSARDERTVAGYIVEIAVTAMRANFGALVLPDAQGRLTTIAAIGWPAGYQGLLDPGQAHAAQAECTIRNGQPIVAEDYTLPLPFAITPALAEHGITSGLSAPIALDGRIAGALLTYMQAPRRFDSKEIRLLSLIAEQASVALENVRLFEAERRGRKSAAALLNMARVASSSLDFKQLLKQLAQRTAAACHAYRCTILLLDQAREILYPITSQFADGHSDFEQWLHFKAISATPVNDVPLFRTAVRERRPVLLDTAQTGLGPPEWTQPFGIQKILLVPLIGYSQVIGLMTLDHIETNRYFSDDQIELAFMIGAQVAPSIENARHYADTQQRLRELRLLHQASQALNTDLSLETVLEAITGQLIAALNVESCTITGWDTERDEVFTFLDRDPMVSAQVEAGSRFSLEEHPHYSVILREAQAQSFRRNDPTLLAIIRDWLDKYFWLSVLTVPLISKGRVFGLIELGERRRERIFSLDEVRLAESLAAQAAAALDNARLYAEATRRATQLRLLHDASRAMISDPRLDAVLQTLIETARRLTDARYAALAVLDADGRPAHFHTAGMPPAESQTIGHPPLGRGLLGSLQQSDGPIRITDLRRNTFATGFPPNHPPMQTFLGVPLTARGAVIGSLYLTDKTDDRPFTQEDEDLVAGLAADATIAIENARLFERIQQMAITDDLTGLYNRRHFFELGEREFDRARRYYRPLAAIMLDIDYFKRVNDTYGHATGDLVLHTVADRCRKNLRDADLLGRYGGEEFVALLPENDLQGAYNAAERLRECIIEAPIETPQGPLRITISLGVACFSEDCSSLTTLLNRADMALYEAKRAGRNRAEIYSTINPSRS